MSDDQQILLEAKLAEDINEFFNVYDIDDLDLECEISESLETASQYSKQFRDVHVELKLCLNDYGEKYTTYDTVVLKLQDYLKRGKKKLRDVKKSKSTVENGARLTQKDERKISLESEYDFFIAKVERKISLKWDIIDEYTEINSGINYLESSLDEWYGLNGKLKGMFEDYNDKFEQNFGELIDKIVDKIEKGRMRLKEILLIHEENTRKSEEQKGLLEQEKINLEKKRVNAEQEKIQAERKNCAINLYEEIKILSANLIQNCTMKLNEVGDHQLLELKKSIFHLTSDLREIMDKVTSFSKLVAHCGDEENRMMTELSAIRTTSAEKVTKFSNELGDLIRTRDISEEKVKSALTLKIELEKFKGFESKMDIYTFKAEFGKLIQPVVLQKLWPDYLKRNFLGGSALTLVENIDDFGEIWKKLTDSYGNMRLLLQNKICGIEKQTGLWKVSGDEKLGMAIASLLNMMSDLSSLAEKFKLEEELYYGGCFEKILSLLGNKIERKFVSKCLKSEAKRPEEWKRLVEFLENEQETCIRLTVLEKSKKCLGIESKNTNNRENRNRSANASNFTKSKKCHICEKYDHAVVKNGIGREEVPYYACKMFVEMTPDDRRKAIFGKKLCAQCLEPGVKFNEDHQCSNDYSCPDKFHKKFKNGLHVLLCSHHKDNQENLNLLEKYKKSVIGKNENLEKFSKEIKISCYSQMFGVSIPNTNIAKSLNSKIDDEIHDSAIFLLQTIKIENESFNLFFDSGCGDMVIKESAVRRLENLGRAKLETPGPIQLSGVGDQKSVCEHGAYCIRIPLKNKREAVISGLCLDKVTAEFPIYPLKSMTKILRSMWKDRRGNRLNKRIPKMPKKVGGDTDILLGAKYLKYFPDLIHKFPSGLSVYKSVFVSSDGSDGVLGGPHPEFTKAEKSQKGVHAGKRSYILQQTEQYRIRSSLENEVPLLGEKLEICDRIRSILENQEISDKLVGSILENEVPLLGENVEVSDIVDKSSPNICVSRKLLKAIHSFEDVQNAGTEIDYRCVGCRDCVECKKSLRLEKVSIQEEVEQSLINRSVSVDIERRITTAALPFLTNPDNKLKPNEHIALKIYKAEARKLAQKPNDKIAVIESQNKLQQLKFVDFLDNLTDEERALIDNELQNFIPWHITWNENSLSTRCRMVFDASHSPRGGCSLNSLLAKGVNSMNKLIEVLIRWTVHRVGFHTDIQKMYNAVFLKPEHWRYQMYLWDDDLDVERPPRRKVIKSLIYGVKPSGNLAERGLRLTAEKVQDLYPRASEIIKKDIYVDDCLSGENSKEEVLTTTDDLKLALERGNFTLKGITYSGSDPPEHLSKDGKTVVVAGLKWFSKGDFISINVKELNFARKNRGRKAVSMAGIIPDNLTKRDCISKVLEIYDPLGRVTPIISGMKLDIHELHTRKLDWDDKIPDNLRKIWVSNFELLQEVGEIKYNRAVVPSDAIDLNIETIDKGDASKNLICAAIYARFRRKNGTFSNQLIFARNKIVSEDITMPRKELMAAILNATTGHVVKLALGDLHKNCWKFTDSQVALFWICCTRAALDVWVRNRVIEIIRLADANLWRYVESKNMCADLGTRKGVEVADIGPESEWICGRAWMKGPEADFPAKTVHELVLDAADAAKVRKECIVLDNDDDEDLGKCLSVGYFTHVQKGSYKCRYEFSNYVIDPLKFRFRKVVRILGLVLLFISKIRSSVKKVYSQTSSIPDIMKTQNDRYILTTGNKRFIDNLKCTPGMVVCLSEEVIAAAMHYFHRKATTEILKFVDKKQYENISVVKSGILHYSGRILSTQEFGGDPSLCEAALDLSKTTFCVPMTDIDSPIARAIVDEIHWNHRDVKHGGVESMLRHVQNIFYVIGGRHLVKSMKLGCIKCKLLEKKAVKVAMGPVQDVNLNIAPAFYNSQVDLCGPFSAYSNANKRATLKLWFVVFCCCTTGAVDCRIMEDYSTDSFILAFIRFSCRFGYPKLLLPDEGSQLVKGCKDAMISFSSLQHNLSTEFGVDFRTCPVGAHYMHGKVERKIQQIKKSMTKELNNRRLSIMQWETLGLQIANSINNLPIGIGNKTDQIENLDILTPNRLILGRNNDRCPTQPLELTSDQKKIIDSNVKIFRAWFNAWLISYVPSLIERPKWFQSDNEVSVGDVVLFLKSEKEFDLQYQYGLVKSVKRGRDGLVRTIEIEYQNHQEKTKRTTIRGVREVVVVHKVAELSDNEN